MLAVIILVPIGDSGIFRIQYSVGRTSTFPRIDIGKYCFISLTAELINIGCLINCSNYKVMLEILEGFYLKLAYSFDVGILTYICKLENRCGLESHISYQETSFFMVSLF